MDVYGHIDADCFYVSCERLREPLLQNKPVAVLGNQGACVIAVSYEMKAMGVKVGEPIWLAKRKCPEGIFIKRDFRWYGVLSHAMQEVLAEFSDEVEYYSVDESFVNFRHLGLPWLELAQNIQSRMLLATGLPVSVGISNTRTLCKLGSKRNKPFGTLAIDESNRKEILKNTNLEQVNGIGRQLIKHCHRLGMHSALDFAEKDRLFIKQHFHKPGESIWYELKGLPVFPIKPERSQLKVISRGGSIWGHYSDPRYIWGFLVRNLERFLTALWSEEIEIQNLTVVLMKSEGGAYQATIPLEDYTSDHTPLFAALKQGFKRAYRRGYKYCRVHIIGQPIRASSRKQLNLFSESDARSQSLKELKVEINKRFGLFTLRNASTGYAAEVFKDKVSDFEITDIEDKHLF